MRLLPDAQGGSRRGDSLVLMERFYENYWSKDKTWIDALREAQL